MKVTKKILTLGVLSMGIVPLAAVSCGEKETTYFESENFRISSKGEMMGYADEGYKKFGSLIINEKYEGVTIKHIAKNAFKDQEWIDEITLPKTLVSIGRSSFQNIKSPVSYTSDHDPLVPIEWDLSHLVNLETIGEGAFRGGENNKQTLTLNLKNLSKLKTIDYYAFYSRNISFINFEGVTKLETIGEGAFKDNQLTSIHIPNSVTSIGGGVCI